MFRNIGTYMYIYTYIYVYMYIYEYIDRKKPPSWGVSYLLCSLIKNRV